MPSLLELGFAKAGAEPPAARAPKKRVIDDDDDYDDDEASGMPTATKRPAVVDLAAADDEGGGGSGGGARARNGGGPGSSARPSRAARPSKSYVDPGSDDEDDDEEDESPSPESDSDGSDYEEHAGKPPAAKRAKVNGGAKPAAAPKPKAAPAKQPAKPSAAKAAKPKPKAGGAAAAAPPSTPAPSGGAGGAATAASPGSGTKKLSKKYQKLSQREHVLQRPDTYIGAVSRAPRKVWVIDEGGTSIRLDEIDVSPGFLKIVDEVLVNAIDQSFVDDQVRAIKVSVDEAKGEITVFNSGRGIPVAMHEQHKVYIPSLIFGEFLSGENFDDTKIRFVGGRNGIGAKAANVYSRSFSVEVLDPKGKKKFKQTWRDNMSKHDEPRIGSAADSAKGYVQIKFRPDFARFGMDGIDAPTLAMLRSRVYDAAACTKPNVRVSFNGKPIDISRFTDYADLVLGKKDERPRAYEKLLDADGLTVRAEIIVAHSTSGSMQAVGFVNGIRCSQGVHVDAIANELAKQIAERLASGKNKDLKIKPSTVKNNLALVCRFLINNPSFDSQTKERLNSPMREWGFKLALSPKFVKDVEKTGVADAVLAFSDLKERQGLSKESSVRRGGGRVMVEKLDDALNAGKPGSNCTLLLTEGDSAKALAVAGVSVVGRANYGIFPLRGKPLNTRKVSVKKLKENAEIGHLMKIIGLEYGKTYATQQALSTLRYKSITIFSDQDLDGHHIAGLIINLVHSQWPSILQLRPDFIKRFATPIIKVSKAGGEQGFFTTQEFREWEDAQRAVGGLTGYKVKYLKGLGSSNNLDAKKYFSNLDEHVVVLRRSGTTCDEAIITAFDPDKADARKTWLKQRYDPDSYIDYGVPEVPMSDFFDKEFIHFSVYDNARSIPSILDGFKPTQRKVMHVFLKRKLRHDVKVSQIGGGIAEATGYHHGETSLVETIVGMAQEHVGTNNINLLKPEGQFGSRLAKPSVHAQPRYIFTSLEPISGLIFRAEDEALLKLKVEEGQTIEPENFLPTLPLVLVNGAAGIGTGWMTDVPCYHPLQLIEALEGLLDAAAAGTLAPVGAEEDEAADALWSELVAADGAAPKPADAPAASAMDVDGFDDDVDLDLTREDDGREGAGPGSAAAGAEAGAPGAAPGARAAGGLVPWYDGFRGRIVAEGSEGKTFTAHGEWSVRRADAGADDVDTVEITELPVGRWTDDFVAELMRKHVIGAEKAAKEAFVKSFDNLSTESRVHIVLHCEPALLRATLDAPGGLAKALKLTTPLRTTNMFLFDETRRLRRFRSPEHILRHFFEWRRPWYAARHRHLDAQLSARIELLANQAAFIDKMSDGSLQLHGKPRPQIEAELEAAGLKRLGKDGAADAADGPADAPADAPAGAKAAKPPSFDYLLHMQFVSLTRDKCEQLRAEIAASEAKLAELRARTPLDLWRADLAELRDAYTEFAATRAKRSAAYDKLKAEGGLKGIKTKKSGTARKRPAAH